MKIGPGLSVELAYELRIKGGDVIESSDRSGPLRYVHGDGKMLPGLEKRLEGLSPGDESEGVIPAKEAFGNEAALPIREMPRSAFPAGTDLKPGAVFQAKDPNSGAPVQFKVLTADAQAVRVRLLHPLADQDIAYKVTVLAVRDPRTQGSAPPPVPGVVELDPDEMAES